ncbi:hypothetical protein MYO4S_00285 [Serratia phage 4S]|nr:hypothetical protein MYO4S_00285 [Serratia phage 4S]
MIYILLYIVVAPFIGKWICKQHDNMKFSDWVTYSLFWIIALPLTIGFNFDDWMAKINVSSRFVNKIEKWLTK